MKSILIAEDEYDIALALEMILGDEGYQVKTVSNGKDALDLLGNEKPDLIILDIMMPYITGIEALEAIRTDPRHSSLPVILMSAAVPQNKIADQPNTRFIRKPFDIDQIMKLIEDLIGRP